MLLRGFAAAIVVAILDQLSKAAILGYFAPGDCSLPQREPITPFLNLVLTCNRGMSFGLLNTGSALSVPLFTLAATAIVGLLIFWLSRVQSELLSIAIGLIIGGAVGNVIDRLHFGGVIDFLYFHAGAWYWPAFNLADAAICVGVVVMLFDGFVGRRHGLQAKQEGDPLP